ncbi:hypothetical protein [Limnobacter sp.]|uniref:hypothetical protein n=1 Tax=Limnobacter sp. TaxID=2003368 RepID=UPI0025C3175A|nr:hypothetical protein [Limnobacter sp.]
MGITPTSIATNKVINTNQDFTNVSVGDYVTLACAPNNYARVTEVNSTTELTLDTDLITSLEHLFRVVSESTAFVLEVDLSEYDSPEVAPNFFKFLSKGDGVEHLEGAPGDYTVTGCKVISVDSPTRCTIDVPLSGGTVLAQPTNSVTGVESEDIAVIYSDPVASNLVVGNGQIAYQFPLNVNIPSGIINGIQNRNVLLQDVLDAIIADVGGAWQSTPSVDRRELGGGEFVFD